MQKMHSDFRHRLATLYRLVLSDEFKLRYRSRTGGSQDVQRILDQIIACDMTGMDEHNHVARMAANINKVQAGLSYAFQI